MFLLCSIVVSAKLVLFLLRCIVYVCIAFSYFLSKARAPHVALTTTPKVRLRCASVLEVVEVVEVEEAATAVFGVLGNCTVIRIARSVPRRRC